MSGSPAQKSLPAGNRLDGYTIEQRIGGGGFSIVYLARADEDDHEVAIKEYMPHKLACRAEDGLTVRSRDPGNAELFSHGQRLFFQEAGTLAALSHPNIVQVTNFFRANGTVYTVMVYEPGVTLQDYIKRHRGNLSERLLRTVFPPLLDGLKLLHSNDLLHLDIKPANILLRPGGSPVLLDFGAVHQMYQTRQYQPAQVITRGFAPPEQQREGGYVGPWSDLYAIGATMRACIEGTTPPPAVARLEQDNLKPAASAFRRRYSRALLTAIDWAMELDPLSRPQSVDQFLQALDTVEPPDTGASVLERIANTLPWNRE